MTFSIEQLGEIDSVIGQWCVRRVPPEIKNQIENQIEQLRAAGHTIDAIDFDLLNYIVPTYYVLTTAEASSNLSRYDGIRFGHRTAENVEDLNALNTLSRTEGFGAEVKKRIMLGTFVLSADYYDAYFTKAQKVRRLIKEKTDSLLNEFDFLIMPTTPTTAFKIGEFSDDALAMYLADVFTVSANLAGIPGVSLPNGRDSQGLAIGLQVLSKSFAEQELLSFSDYLIKNKILNN